jgi:hypothetical protein
LSFVYTLDTPKNNSSGIPDFMIDGGLQCRLAGGLLGHFCMKCPRVGFEYGTEAKVPEKKLSHG